MDLKTKKSRTYLTLTNELLAKDKEITQRKKWALPVWIIQENTNQVGMLPTSRPGYVFTNSISEMNHFGVMFPLKKALVCFL
jgi:hypothetical protein